MGIQATHTDLETLTLAALFYDIGRFKKRAFAEAAPAQDVGDAWLHDQLPRVAAGITRWQTLIAEAAFLAAGGELPEEPHEDAQALQPLVSVFSTLSLPTRTSPMGQTHYYPLAVLSEYPVYPGPPLLLSRLQYRELWHAFETELAKLTHGHTGDLTISQALFLLEKFMSFIPLHPSEPGQPYADIPLFDHMQGTAALAACLYRSLGKGQSAYSERDIRNRIMPRYLLVGGDFSGVQPFVYRVFSKGALKALKGRAIFLEILTEYVIRKLVAPLGLSRANLLYSGGSCFTVLLPDTPEARKRVAEVRNVMNTYLTHVHEAKLYLVLEYLRCSGRDFVPDAEQRIAKTQKELAGAIAIKKSQKFMELLVGAGRPGDQRCRHCGRSIAEADLSPAEELRAWHITGQEGKDWAPLCRFCFLLVPKEPAHPIPEKEDWGDGQCQWCNEPASAELPLIRLEVAGEDIFGCQRQQCLGETKAGECQVCHRHALLTRLPPPSGAEDVWTCPLCRCLYHLGEHLSDVHTILETTKAPPEQPKVFLKIEDTYYYFPREPMLPWQQRLSSDADTTVWVVNSWDVEAYQGRQRVFPFLLGNYTVRSQEAGKMSPDLSDLAQASCGAAKIGALRMDIDSLGDVFSKGFDEAKRTFARLPALSRALSRFFKCHLNVFCQNAGWPPNYQQLRMVKPLGERSVAIVYAGGDDLFVIGAWDDIIELSFDLQAAFQAYTCASLTLSGGMLVQDDHYPVYHLAELAGKAVQRAKEHKDDKQEKNSLAPFYPAHIFTVNAEPVSESALFWEDAGVSATHIRDLVREFMPLGTVKDNRWQPVFPRSFLHTLLRVVQDRLRVAQDRKARAQLSLPHLAYALSRWQLAEGQESNAVLQARKKARARQLYRLETFRYLHPALIWLDLLSRDKGESAP